MQYSGDQYNPLYTKNGISSVSTMTGYLVSPLVVTTIVANPNRLSIDFWNETGTLYVALGVAASDTNYSYRLTANTSLPKPIEGYTGIITMIKATGTTAVRVTEIG